VDPFKPFIVKMDVFNFIIGIVLLQLEEKNFLHPISFYFHKFSLIEINYKIHDKELLAIMDVF